MNETRSELLGTKHTKMQAGVLHPVHKDRQRHWQEALFTNLEMVRAASDLHLE